MKRSTRLDALPILFTVAVAVAAGANAEAGDTALRASIEQRSQEFAAAYNRGDLAAIAGMYTEDAMAFPPDSPVVSGRPALRALWQSSRDGGVQSVTLRTEGVEGSGRLAVETGTGVLDVRGGDGSTTRQQMKFVVVWRHDTDGVWRLHRDIWNGLPASE